MKMAKNKRYLIYWNLRGIHPIQTCYRTKCKITGKMAFWSKDGNYQASNEESIEIKDCVASLTFKDEKEAIKIYRILKAYSNHVKRIL